MKITFLVFQITVQSFVASSFGDQLQFGLDQPHPGLLPHGQVNLHQIGHLVEVVELVVEEVDMEVMGPLLDKAMV